MVGEFKGRFLGAEAIRRKDNTVRYQATFLFGKKSEVLQVEEFELFQEVSKLAELTSVIAVIDIIQKNWNGSTYVNYDLKEFYTDAVSKSETSEQEKKQAKQTQNVR